MLNTVTFVTIDLALNNASTKFCHIFDEYARLAKHSFDDEIRGRIVLGISRVNALDLYAEDTLLTPETWEQSNDKTIVSDGRVFYLYENSTPKWIAVERKDP